jgi:hypothetical protein
MQFYPDETTEAHLKRVEVRLLGTGASVPTKQLGQGITVTRTGTGVYKLTFGESQGVWRGHTGVGFEATTPADLKTHSVVFGAYNTTTRAIELTLYDASGNAHDLAALEFLNFTLRFKQTSV